MTNSSRPLTLAGLRGFLSAARHLSFTRAAAELHLSQSALSRQVQGLEEEVGTALFVRGTRRVALTPAGEALERASRIGLGQIDDCVAGLRQAGGRRQVSITTFASFASLWLIPRLASFGAAQPGVDVNCMATDRLVDLESEGVDVALRCSATRILPPEGEYLFDEFMVPVCSPSLLERGPPLREPSDLGAHTLLKQDAATEAAFPWLAWEGWLGEQALAGLAVRGTLRFTNHDQVIQAALAGQGVALARGALVSDILSSGRLATPLGPGCLTAYSYYAVSSRAGRARPEVRAFLEWVVSQARSQPAPMPAPLRSE